MSALSIFLVETKGRKTTQEAGSITEMWRRSEITTDICRYSGPDPQILPFPPDSIVQILARILSYLDRVCDKKNVRLASKGFAAASLSMLTSTAYFSTSLIKLDDPWGVISRFSSSILEMAMDPIVSQNVTKVVCDDTLFPNFFSLSLQNWWASQSKDRTSVQIMDSRNHHVSNYSHERWIIRHGEDRRIFRTALGSFVNLKSIVFRDVIADEQDRQWPRSTWPSEDVLGDL